MLVIDNYFQIIITTNNYLEKTRIFINYTQIYLNIRVEIVDYEYVY